MAAQPAPKRYRMVDGRSVVVEGSGNFHDNYLELKRKEQKGGPAGGGLPPARVEDQALMPSSYYATQRRSFIYSKGRMDPEHEQGLVTKQYRLNRHLYAQRAKTSKDDGLAPLGSKSDFSLMKGVLLFAEVKSGLLSCRPTVRAGGLIEQGQFQGINGFGDLDVFDTVNGLPKSTHIMFVGVNKTEVDFTKENFDEAVTAVLRGTQTAVNVGPCQIKAGEPVGFLMTPLMLEDGDGRVCPAVKQDDLPATKFRPTLFPMREISGAEAVLRCLNIAAEEYKERPGMNAGDDFEGVAAAAERRFRQRSFALAGDQKSASSQRFSGDTMPLDMLLRWEIILLAFASNNARASDLEWYKRVQQENERHMRACSAANVTDLLKAKSEMPAPGVSDANKLEMIAFIDMRKAQCQLNQAMWVQQRYVGEALNNSSPGGQLELLLG